MKKIFVSVFTVALLIACSGKQSEEHGHEHSDGTHEHDGEHDHPHDETNPHKQEEFTVGQDTISNTTEHGHDHKDGHDHQH
jgi:ABC-type nickel/cobalt efflux system permease component RcnA